MTEVRDETMDQNGQGDSTDARGIFSSSKSCSSSKPCHAEAVLPGSIEREDYYMGYPKVGQCYIFNHKEFDPHTGLNVRNGTDADAARLYCRFRELGFEVKMFTDLKVREIEKELVKAGKADHSDEACFVCCVLSHGESGILFGRDGKYLTEQVFAPFRGDVCISLAGKPKVFFIQACQGDKLDGGVNIICRESSDSDESQNFKIPTHADFLIAYSTVPGFYSWRNTTNGSWFIQSLCAVLKDHAKDKDLLQLLTIVNRRVALDFHSFTPQEPSMHLKKQVPCVTSTLTRNLKF